MARAKVSRSGLLTSTSEKAICRLWCTLARTSSETSEMTPAVIRGCPFASTASTPPLASSQCQAPYGLATRKRMTDSAGTVDTFNRARTPGQSCGCTSAWKSSMVRGCVPACTAPSNAMHSGEASMCCAERSNCQYPKPERFRISPKRPGVCSAVCVVMVRSMARVGSKK